MWLQTVSHQFCCTVNSSSENGDKKLLFSLVFTVDHRHYGPASLENISFTSIYWGNKVTSPVLCARLDEIKLRPPLLDTSTQTPKKKR